MFHKLTIKDIKRETPECVSLSLHVPDGLKENFIFTQGQHLVFRGWHEGEEIRRSYSICSSPYDDELRVAVKRIEEGVFSSHIHSVATVGDEVEVMFPQGSFYTDLNPDQAKRYVMVAAGSGITPIMAIARSVLAASPESTFDLVYANRSAGDVMFAEEIGDLKDRYPARFAVHHVLSREQRLNPLLTGRIESEKLTALLDHVLRTEDTDEWFLCGPFELVQLVRDELEAREISSEKVRFELFSTGRPDRPAGNQGRRVEVEAGYVLTCQTRPTSEKLVVNYDA